MSIELQARNTGLEQLAEMLRNQHAMKFDVVTPLSNLSSAAGVITVHGTSVFDEGQRFTTTDIAVSHLAARLGIPPTYLKTLAGGRPDLFDDNVNGFTQGGSAYVDDDLVFYAPDDRSVLLRSFINADDPTEPGILRAVLSDRYGIIDNLDVLMAALEGVTASGTNVEILGCDLTERRMTIRVAAPELLVHAPALLAGYRSPLGHERVTPQWAQDKYGVNEDGIVGGFVITNSETGGGAFSITPRLMVLACTNGMMITRDALRQVHLGGRLDEGVVRWSGDTQQKSLQLVTAQARDAVATFLDTDYMAKVIEAATTKATTPLVDPTAAIEYVSKKLAYTQDQQAGILDHFIRGGQVTAGGVMQAVTSFAQTVENPDVAYDLEAGAFDAMELAASR